MFFWLCGKHRKKTHGKYQIYLVLDCIVCCHPGSLPWPPTLCKVRLSKSWAGLGAGLNDHHEILDLSGNGERRGVEFGSGRIQVEGLQYVGSLVVGGWFLKWSCFFLVWMRQLADFWTRGFVEAGNVGTKLRPKASTSVSVEDSWWQERFLMIYFWSSPFPSPNHMASLTHHLATIFSNNPFPSLSHSTN